MKRGIAVLVSLSALVTVGYLTASKWAIRHETPTCRAAKAIPCCPLLKPNAHLMNLASRPIGAMRRKHTFIGILLLSLALVPCAAMAELNDGSLSSTGQNAPIHHETNRKSDQRFHAAFRDARLSLVEAIAMCRTIACGVTDRRDIVRYIGQSLLSGEDRQRQRDMGKRHRCSYGADRRTRDCVVPERA